MAGYRTRLTEAKIEALRPGAERYEVRDEKVPALLLRVGVRPGNMVWEVVVSQNGRRRRHRLGQYPALSLKEARNAAEAAKANPTGSRVVGVKTVADLFARYRDERSGVMRAWCDVQSVWDNWAKASIGPVRLTDLTEAHGLDLRDHVRRNSSAVRASAVLRYLRPMMGWAKNEGFIAVNPWSDLKAPVVAQRRDRVLSVDEWQALSEWAADAPSPFGPFVKALMLSGQRLSNVAQMRWDEIAGDVWVIPADKMKATRSDAAKTHEVPLSQSFAALIASQPCSGPYVFSFDGQKPLSPGSSLKARISEATDLRDWRFHDIRRTAATLIAEAGAGRFIVERILGHADTGVTAIYDRATYRVEKRAALEELAATLEGHAGLSRVRGAQ